MDLYFDLLAKREEYYLGKIKFMMKLM